MCKAITKAGTACSRKPVDGGQYCRQHSFDKKGKSANAPHPPFKIMLARAIIAVPEGKNAGATRPYIKKYLAANYKVNPNSYIIRNGIRNALEDGSIFPHHIHKGHYKLSKEMRDMIEKIDKD